MSVPQTIVRDLGDLQTRLSHAVANCESWRASGLTEQYIEAYNLVEALQLQLRQRLQLEFRLISEPSQPS